MPRNGRTPYLPGRACRFRVTLTNRRECPPFRQRSRGSGFRAGGADPRWQAGRIAQGLGGIPPVNGAVREGRGRARPA